MAYTVNYILIKYFGIGNNHEKAILDKACYTGNLLNIEKFFGGKMINNYSSKDKIMYNNLIKEILNTHNIINNLIESFNEDTNYKFKKVFEIRNNYCNDEYCSRCYYLTCDNNNKYSKIEKNLEEDLMYCELIRKIQNELIIFKNKNLYN